jgi:hypothetical protein
LRLVVKADERVKDEELEKDPWLDRGCSSDEEPIIDVICIAFIDDAADEGLDPPDGPVETVGDWVVVPVKPGVLGATLSGDVGEAVTDGV